MRIAVYSGSFDPLHIGHLAIMRHLTEQMDFDMVYLVVSPQNPFKSAEMAMSGKQRFIAAKEALGRHPGLKVRAESAELDMPAPHYTIRTLDFLSSREQENTFTLVMGADNLCGLNRWKDYGRILSEYGVAAYPRKGYDLTEIRKALLAESGLYRIELMDAPIVDISSTDIRNAISEGKDVSRFLM